MSEHQRPMLEVPNRRNIAREAHERSRSGAAITEGRSGDRREGASTPAFTTTPQSQDRVPLRCAVEPVPAAALRTLGRAWVRGGRGSAFLADVALASSLEGRLPPLPLAREPLPLRARSRSAPSPPFPGKARPFRSPLWPRRGPGLPARLDDPPSLSPRVFDRDLERRGARLLARSCDLLVAHDHWTSADARSQLAISARRSPSCRTARTSAPIRRAAPKRGAARARPAAGQLRFPLLRGAACLQGDRALLAAFSAAPAPEGAAHRGR